MRSATFDDRSDAGPRGDAGGAARSWCSRCRRSCRTSATRCGTRSGTRRRGDRRALAAGRIATRWSARPIEVVVQVNGKLRGRVHGAGGRRREHRCARRRSRTRTCSVRRGQAGAQVRVRARQAREPGGMSVSAPTRADPSHCSCWRSSSAAAGSTCRARRRCPGASTRSTLRGRTSCRRSPSNCGRALDALGARWRPLGRRGGCRHPRDARISTGRRVLSVSARNTPQEYQIFYVVELLDRPRRRAGASSRRPSS